MRALGLAGAIAIAFGLVSYYATGELGRFAVAHLLAGGAALALWLATSLGRLRVLGTPAARTLLARHALGVIALVAAGAALEWGAQALGWRLDWTLDRRFELSPAVRATLAALPDDLAATLYYDREDPRARSTRLLLDSFARTGELHARERVLDDAPEDVERYGITSSNSVLLEVGGRTEVVERPTEGTLWEALERLRVRDERRRVYVVRGAGGGDPTRRDAVGFSGLVAALATEGYAPRELVLAAADAVPDDAAAVLVIAPERGHRPESLGLLQRYLAAGGGLVALLEPGRDSGLEALLAAWGFDVPDGVVVDPAAGPSEGDAPGLNPLAYAYADHPVTRLLDAQRMTFFHRARPAEAARKPEPQDRLASLVFTSPRAWLSRDFASVERGLVPRDREGAPVRRYALGAVGSYPRGEREARIAVFGDSDFASNAYLRALYNLDLVMNALHWVAQRSDAVSTRRPNVLTVVQRPLTPQESLAMFYGVGLLLPEAFLIAAAVTWLRRRSG